MDSRDMRSVSGLTRLYEYARTLSKAVDIKADYFPGHGDSVGYLLGIMAVEAGLDRPTQDILRVFGLLHDVGKIMIPVNILNKPSSLNMDEWNEIKSHPRHGEMIVRAAGLDDIAGWIRHHHEHWDGSGYPDGLMGEEIPWQSRWLLVADAVHVMMSERPYQGPMKRRYVHEELHRCSTRQFDPEAVALFLEGAINVPA